MSIVKILTRWINPKSGSQQPPEDNRQVVDPIDERMRWQRQIFGVIALVGMLVIPLFSIFQLETFHGGLAW